jgi:hypothetical protein
MNREKLMEQIEEIQNRNYAKFKGSNEADLMVREEVADLFENEIHKIVFDVKEELKNYEK